MFAINEDEHINDIIKDILKKQNKNNFTMVAPTSGDKTVQTGLDRYITVTSKRRRSPSSIPLTKNKKANINTDPINVANFFEALKDLEPEPKVGSAKEEKEVKPPPIYLREKTTNTLINELKAVCGNEFYVTQIKRGRIDETKIQAKSINAYRKTVTLLESNKRNYYTFQMKGMRAFSVIIKGIDATVNCNDIKDELQEKGFLVRAVINIKNRQKIAQPMFRIELEPEKGKGKHPIYDLKYLLYRRIVVEEPHKRNGPTQCFNCQEFGHTRGYCQLKPTCVSCGSLHKSEVCPNNKTDPQQRKCANCGENHTANYRGCVVYSNEQKKFIPKQNSQQKLLNIQQKHRGYPPVVNAFVQPGQSYARVVREPEQPTLGQNTTNSTNSEINIAQVLKQMQDNMNNFMNMMQNMMQSMNAMMQLLTHNQK